MLLLTFKEKILEEYGKICLSSSMLTMVPLKDTPSIIAFTKVGPEASAMLTEAW